MKSLALAVLFAVGASSFSFCGAALADEKVELKTGGGAQDLLNNTKIPSELTSSHAEKVKAKVTLSCTDKAGKTYQKNEPEYEICKSEQLREAAKKGQLGNPASTAPGATIHFGN